MANYSAAMDMGWFFRGKFLGKGREAVWKVPRPIASLYREELKGSPTPCLPTDNSASDLGKMLGAAPQVSLGEAEETCPGGLLGRRSSPSRLYHRGQCLQTEPATQPRSSSGPEHHLGGTGPLSMWRLVVTGPTVWLSGF